MIVDDNIFNKHIKHLIAIGLSQIENYKKYYELVNNTELRRFLIESGASTPHFRFLSEVLDNPKLTKCPECGHYNDNIECPIIRCEVCDNEWKIETPSSDEVCGTCIAHQTENCNKKPPRKA